jgi:hypothetical protein
MVGENLNSERSALRWRRAALVGSACGLGALIYAGGTLTNVYVQGQQNPSWTPSVWDTVNFGVVFGLGVLASIIGLVALNHVEKGVRTVMFATIIPAAVAAFYAGWILLLTGVGQ